MWDMMEKDERIKVYKIFGVEFRTRITMAELQWYTVPRLHTYSLQIRSFSSANSCFAMFTESHCTVNSDPITVNNIDEHLQGNFTYCSLQSWLIRHHTIKYLPIIQKAINLKHTDLYFDISLTVHHEITLY